jgi:hypothetical protein
MEARCDCNLPVSYGRELEPELDGSLEPYIGRPWVDPPSTRACSHVVTSQTLSVLFPKTMYYLPFLKVMLVCSAAVDRQLTMYETPSFEAPSSLIITQLAAVPFFLGPLSFF